MQRSQYAGLVSALVTEARRLTSEEIEKSSIAKRNFVHYGIKFRPLPNRISSIEELNSIHYKIKFHPLGNLLLRLLNGLGPLFEHKYDY